MQRQYPPFMSYLIMDHRVVEKQCEVLQKLDLKEYKLLLFFHECPIRDGYVVLSFDTIKLLAH